jgi:cytidine deaminase
MKVTTSRLIEAARAVVGDLKLRKDFSAGGVGAAILTVQGNVYTGICIDLGCGLGFCAEVAAIAQMLTHRETQIDMVVAVTSRGILPPCGRCRETMAQIDVRNLDCKVIVGEDREVLLRDLLPDHWLTEDEDTEPRAGADPASRAGHPAAKD